MNFKYLSFLMIAFSLSICTSVSSAEHAALIGKWQGFWDEVWPAEFKISKNILNKKKSDKNYLVKYRWKEHPNGNYSKFDHFGKIINDNTIHAGKMYLVIDLKDNNKAMAFGVFDGRTRIAYLNRIITSSQ